MKRRVFLGAAAAIALGMSLAPGLLSAGDGSGPVFTGGTPGVAINGYDTVAYFTEQSHVEGSDEFTHEWNGVTWRFASAENRDAFAASPEKYAPQYGGYCAYAAASNSLVKTEPEAWSIVDDKLYLNYNLPIRARWEKDEQGYIEAADANWPELSKQ